MKKFRIGTRCAFLFPLIVALVVLWVVTLFIGIKNDNFREKQQLSSLQENVLGGFKERLKLETKSLEGDLVILGHNKRIQKNWLSQDRSQLQKVSQPFFEDLNKTLDITHFYFISPDKKCFLRVHRPKSYGDTIPRFTLKQAVDTGEIASGIELGKFGTFTLRVVMPWKIDGKLIGYIELGKEIENLTQHVKNDLGVDLFFLIRKHLVNHQDWVDGQETFGKKENWDLLENYFVADRTWDKIPKKLLHKLQEGELNFIQLKVVYQSGDIHYFDAVTVPLIDARGEEVGYIWIVKNDTFEHSFFQGVAWQYITVILITGAVLCIIFYFSAGYLEMVIKRHQRNLSQMEATVQQAMDGVAITDMEGKFTYVNESWAKMHGLEVKDCIGSGFSLFHTKRQLQDEVMPIHEKLKEGEHFVGEVNHVKADGSEFPTFMSTFLLQDEQGNPMGMAGIAHDITHRKKMENEMLEKGRELQEYIDHSFAFSCKLNTEGDIMMINKTANDSIGEKKDSIVGKMFIETPWWSYSEECKKRIKENLQEALAGEFVVVEDKASTLRGIIDVLIVMSPIKDENGKVKSIIVEGINISDRVRVEIELEKARQEAENANSVKSEFLANMSHEIRTPMNGILGMNELLLETELDEEQRDYANTISLSATSLLTILNDILDFSKMEAGKLELVSAPFNLRSLIEEVGRLLEPKAYAKNLELLLRMNPGMPEVYIGDATRIRQVIVNLTGNALKFTQSGYVIIDVDSQSKISTQDTMAISISVRDTGIGIEEEKTELIFEKFTQADGSISREFGGTGLGLAICNQLVHLMDGTLSIQSKVGKGTSFQVILTLDPCKDAVGTERANTTSWALRKKRILFVDDNKINRDIFMEYLGNLKLKCDEADSAEETLAKIKEAGKSGNQYDIVLIEHQLPDMDGLELAEKLPRDIMLVLMTSSAKILEAGKGFSKFGIDAHFPKPMRLAGVMKLLVSLGGGSKDKKTPERKKKKEKSSKKTASPEKKDIQPDIKISATELKVLLVEDNPVNLKLAEKLLCKLGCEVTTAKDGAEALTKLGVGKKNIRYFPFDLVFMDCQMPNKDGYEATMEIRRFEEDHVLSSNPEKPMLDDKGLLVIAMTANAMIGDREKCMVAGMNDYITKPIKSHEIEQVLRKWKKI